MARPLISLFFPHLADLCQPLAGECAARRDVLEAVPFVGGYGVDLGLLIDVTERFGTPAWSSAIWASGCTATGPLAELGVQALAILQLALAAGRGWRPSTAGAGPVLAGRPSLVAAGRWRPPPSPWSSGPRSRTCRPTARRPELAGRV